MLFILGDMAKKLYDQFVWQFLVYFFVNIFKIKSHRNFICEI